jgi:hypothetical protein
MLLFKINIFVVTPPFVDRLNLLKIKQNQSQAKLRVHRMWLTCPLEHCESSVHQAWFSQWAILVSACWIAWPGKDRPPYPERESRRICEFKIIEIIEAMKIIKHNTPILESTPLSSTSGILWFPLGRNNWQEHHTCSALECLSQFTQIG